jgi:hypothetical protein
VGGRRQRLLVHRQGRQLGPARGGQGQHGGHFANLRVGQGCQMVMFLNQEFQFGDILEGLAMEDVGIHM